MSQKSQSDDSQKHFAVGRGLLAAAETLNFNMKEQHHSRQMGGMSSGVGMGGAGGMEGHSTKNQMTRRGGGGGGNLGSTMKLFASLGLSPSDLDALAEIPEEDISVETLPRILMQLKSRKVDSGERRAASMSSDSAYRGGRDNWDEGQGGRMGSSSLGQGSSRTESSSDFGYNSLQDVSSGRNYSLNYSSSSSDGSRERSYSGLSHQDSYGGLGLRPSQSDSVFMQKRMGSPSNGKVQDFLGVTPPMFPHVCSLCDFDVHSSMEWNQHTSGLRHAENRRLLLDMYPEWDPGMSSARGDGLLDMPNMSAGRAPLSSGGTGGMSSSWGGGGPGLSGKNQLGQNKLRSRVVVVNYDRKPLSNKTLFDFTKPFGILREHLILKTKAFLEMNNHEEALNVVNYYEQHPASLYGKPLIFYLSQTLMVIEKDKRLSDQSMDRGMDREMNRGMDRVMDRAMDRPMKSQDSKVVFFSNLPRGDEDKEELLTIAGQFGTVDKHLFLTDQAFVQLGTVEDAKMLLKYYSVNPLTIKGRVIRLNICTKYKTLTVKPKQGRTGGDQRGNRGNLCSSSSSASSRGSTTSATFNRERTSSTSRSMSNSKTREEKKREEEREKTAEDAAAAGAKAQEEAQEEEEEVSGVMQGREEGGEEEEEDENEDSNGEKAEGEEPERAEQEKESEEVQQKEQVPEYAPWKVGGAEDKAKPGAEPGGTEAEASTDKSEHKDKAGESSEAAEGDEPEAHDDDFMENMEDFVTLDELQEDEEEAESDTTDHIKRGGRRVVNIVGFRRGHNFLEEMLGLARPFGKVIRHLVLDLKPEAFLEFATEEEARAMTKFYNSNVTANVCGRPVCVNHSISYLTIQCGLSRVVYVGQIPNSKYTDRDILKLAEPFGKVHKYFLNRIRRECFLEMETAEDAEKMAEAYKSNPRKFNGKRLMIYVSRKYRQLKHGYLCSAASKREKSRTPPTSSQNSDEPPAKKLKEEVEPEEQQEEKEKEQQQEEEKEEEQQQQEEEKKEDQQQQQEEVEDKEAVKDEVDAPSRDTSSEDVRMKETPEEKSSDEEEQTNEMETNQNRQTEAPPPTPAAEPKPSVASLPLPPYDPDNAVGVEYVKMGYYCRVCLLFYSNEETAKKTHCSSQAHYDKLQKYLEKEQKKTEKKQKKVAA